MRRPWTDFPISDCGEPLEFLPDSLYCLRPHPYQSLGAPYGEGQCPWKLRFGLISLLHQAQKSLQKKEPMLQLAIFDAWRPIQVQAFMVDYSINKECSTRGLVRDDKSDLLAVKEVVDQVEQFWAMPDYSKVNPPPHSTGGAIDLTIATIKGFPLDMGGEIDCIGPVSFPNHYRQEALLRPTSQEYLWHERRNLLSDVMGQAGFVQHPNEWWHFSYGDQLWAWTNRLSNAIYGQIDHS